MGEAGSWYSGRDEVSDDRQTQLTREWFESAAILLNSCFHSIASKPGHTSGGQVSSSVGTVLLGP